MISQAEHDELASALLITTANSLVARVQDQIAKQLTTLDRASVAKQSLSKRGAIIVTKKMDEAIELSNRYAPEHLVISVDDPDGISKQVYERGCDIPGPLHAGCGWRLHRRTQPRAPDGWNRAILLAAWCGRLPQAHERHAIRAA